MGVDIEVLRSQSPLDGRVVTICNGPSVLDGLRESVYVAHLPLKALGFQANSVVSLRMLELGEGGELVEVGGVAGRCHGALFAIRPAEDGCVHAWVGDEYGQIIARSTLPGQALSRVSGRKEAGKGIFLRSSKAVKVVDGEAPTWASASGMAWPAPDARTVLVSDAAAFSVRALDLESGAAVTLDSGDHLMHVSHVTLVDERVYVFSDYAVLGTRLASAEPLALAAPFTIVAGPSGPALGHADGRGAQVLLEYPALVQSLQCVGDTRTLVFADGAGCGFWRVRVLDTRTDDVRTLCGDGSIVSLSSQKIDRSELATESRELRPWLPPGPYIGSMAVLAHLMPPVLLVAVRPHFGSRTTSLHKIPLWGWVHWRPERHHMFPLPVRAAIETVLIIAKRREADSGLGILPLEIVWMIAAAVATADGWNDARGVEKSNE
ncbi:uncharacterized protein AMSG_07968 [Thecamonas trahens ATCC 50062]|uniref:Uncharacterized protein n=1 Tax=Thecamonas trahens ATCC 50062 TaxID=461836 RepID=A0A0L0DID6_THETB|nr:hypothetical protein AMSG_07968 [Thecamonas trahens ATCC 50062]KNC51871.1 hypothetical protein AMSG_07968 [Thecamonas trahens ATCC 50062]|eukprot:XP_013755730.1 hypothetical protein AMSG_07968 [Thecamonas trahens ATCC 50062]